MNINFKDIKISLKLKISSLFILLVIAIMATVTYYFTIRELNLRVQQVKLRMERLANNIATIRSVETEDWDIYQTYLDNQLKLNEDIVYIAIFDEKDKLKAHALNFELIDLDYNQTLTKTERERLVLRLDQRQIVEESQKDMESKSVNIIIGNQNLGTVKVGFSLVELNDAMTNNLNRNLQLAVIFILLAMIVSYFMSNRIVTPLGKLTSAMLKISQGNLNQEIHIVSRDEIGEMAETFNFMTKGLQEKKMIEDFSRELGFTIELKRISDLITRRISVALNANQGFLFIKEKNKSDNFELISCYPEILKDNISLRHNLSLCQYFLSTRSPQPLSNFSNFPELYDQLTKIKTISDKTLVTPIILKKEVVGIFLLTVNNKNIPYKEGEKNFLSTLIGQGGFAIESALLYEELTEQERLKRELEIAHAVQKNLLPRHNPNIQGLDIAGTCIPADEIGGDYYDYFLINDHTVGIAIADVTGKGTSAAFYMAVIKGIMLSLAAIFSSPKQLLRELNKRLYGSMDKKVFITMTYAIVDIKRRRLTFARAGHSALIMRKANNSEVKCFAPLGIGLGLDKGNLFDSTITEQEIKFTSGDTFVFYTDGISEAMNPYKKEFGEQRLVDLIARLNLQTSLQIQQSIIEAVNKFVRGAPQHDDITMVTVIAT